jgi:hypothetical protein
MPLCALRIGRNSAVKDKQIKPKQFITFVWVLYFFIISKTGNNHHLVIMVSPALSRAALVYYILAIENGFIYSLL